MMVTVAEMNNLSDSDRKLSRETIHDMRQIAAGELLGVTAALEALEAGKGRDGLQDLVHHFSVRYQGLFEQEQRLP